MSDPTGHTDTLGEHPKESSGSQACWVTTFKPLLAPRPGGNSLSPRLLLAAAAPAGTFSLFPCILNLLSPCMSVCQESGSVFYLAAAASARIPFVLAAAAWIACCCSWDCSWSCKLQAASCKLQAAAARSCRCKLGSKLQAALCKMQLHLRLHVRNQDLCFMTVCHETNLECKQTLI